VKRAALVLAVLCLAVRADAADLRRVESIGVAPLGGAGSKTSSPRNVAVRAAVARAVETVAQQLDPDLAKPDEETGAPDTHNGPAISPDLARALGEDPLDYAPRYRILQDRGVQSVAAPAPGGADKQYVVVVEVQVDAARVRERLRAAGWLATPSDRSATEMHRLILEGVADYRALDSVRRLLVEQLGARRALPVELQRGRVVLAVEGGPEPAELAAALQAAAPPELRLEPVEADTEDAVTLVVEWSPPPGTPAEPGPESAGAN
jgi:hypothetical protein